MTNDYEEACKLYDKHLENHIDNVNKAYQWFVNHSIIVSDKEVKKRIYEHDDSKYSNEEYSAYVRYFNMEQTDEVVKNFKYAWLHHIHNNPHHWQYWLLQNDEDGLEVLDIPDEYIIEMLCDWYSFSISAKKPYEIFNWYNNNKSKIKFSVKTRKTVETYLDKIRKALDDESKSKGE